MKTKVDQANTKHQDPNSKEAADTGNHAHYRALRSTNIVDLHGPLFIRPGTDTQTRPTSAEERSVYAALTLSEAANEKRPEDCASETTSTKPLAIYCKVAKGQLGIALGPWRASGHWWEPDAWERAEWDVQTRDGQALRLVQSNGEWRVEAIVD